MIKSQQNRNYRPIITIGVIIAGFLGYVHFTSDSYIVASADSQMVALADKAYMTESAKVLFLKTNPERVDSARIEKECGVSKDTNNPLELGCYDPNNNKIFLRDLPERFDNYEPVIAAHEMLHAAYAKIRPDSSVLQELRTAQQSLKSRLDVYTGIDEEGMLNEIHSITATESRPTSEILKAYYSNYIYDQPSVAQLNENQTIELNNMRTELNNVLVVAQTWENAANQYYANHSAATSYGDARNANYYYNKYTESLNTYNQQVTDYNLRIVTYNSIIEALNGKPLQKVPVEQAQ